MPASLFFTRVVGFDEAGADPHGARPPTFLASATAQDMTVTEAQKHIEAGAYIFEKTSAPTVEFVARSVSEAHELLAAITPLFAAKGITIGEIAIDARIYEVLDLCGAPIRVVPDDNLLNKIVVKRFAETVGLT